MTLTIFWLAVLAALLFNCAVNALFLWLVCKFSGATRLADKPLEDSAAARAPRTGYGRCLVAVVWFAVLNFAASLALSRLVATLSEENVWASWVCQLLISLALAAYVIHWQLRLATRKTWLVALIWLALLGLPVL